MADTLSKQASRVTRNISASTMYFRQANSNKYDAISNPQGICNLGLAENKLCTDLLMEKIQEISLQPEDKSLLFYANYTGLADYKLSMKRFLEKRFNSLQEIDVNGICITNGVTVILEALAFALADPGDYLLVPAPFYYRIKNDLFERAAVKVLEVPLTYHNNTNGYARLAREDLESVYQKAVHEGKCVRGVLIVNPVNPTGDVLDREQLLNLLDFAHTHQLHVISNEIYALSIFDPKVTFTSILALPHPDPERVHFTWGVSKDFGLSGYRCGIFYTGNECLRHYFSLTGVYFRAAGLIQKRLQALIDDQEWLDSIFFPSMKRRMNQRFQEFRKAVSSFDVQIHASSATMFLWISLAKYLPKPTFEGEKQLLSELINAGVFFLGGADFYHNQPGWFRIVCSVDEDVFQLALKRLTGFLQRQHQKH